MRVLGHFQDYPPQSHKHFYLSYKFNYLTENPRWMLHPNSRTLSKSKMAAASLFGFSSLTTLPKTADHTFAESLPKACRKLAEYFLSLAERLPNIFHGFIVSLFHFRFPVRVMCNVHMPSSEFYPRALSAYRHFHSTQPERKSTHFRDCDKSV